MSEITYMPSRLEVSLSTQVAKLILTTAVISSSIAYIIFIYMLSDQNGWSIMAALYCLIPFVILYVWYVLIHHLYKIHSYFDGWQNWDFLPYNKDDRERAKTIAMLRIRSFFVVFVIGVCLVLVLPLSKTIPSGAVAIDKSGEVYSAGSQARVGKLFPAIYLIPLEVHAHVQHTREFQNSEMSSGYGVTIVLDEPKFLEFAKTRGFREMRAFKKADHHSWYRYYAFMKAFDIDNFLNERFTEAFNLFGDDIYRVSDEGLMLQLGLVIQSKKDTLPTNVANIKIDSMKINSISTKD